MSYTVDTRSLTWRPGRHPAIREATATVWGAGKAQGGLRTTLLCVESGRVGEEWILAVRPRVAGIHDVRMRTVRAPMVRHVRGVTREATLSHLHAILRAMADDLARAWASDGERMPGCGNRLAVGVTKVTTS